MTIDTFLIFLITTALIKIATKNIVAYVDYFLLGVPNQIKTGYYSQAFEMFYQQFNVIHVTEIFIIPKETVLWNFKSISFKNLDVKNLSKCVWHPIIRHTHEIKGSTYWHMA